MNEKIVEQLLSVLKGYRRDVVEKLAGKYKFEVLEALEYLNQDTSSETVVPVKEKVVKAKVAKVTLTEEEKAAKLAEKEAEKAAKLAEKEAEKQAKLAEKLAEKEAEKQKKLAEKEAKASNPAVKVKAVKVAKEVTLAEETQPEKVVEAKASVEKVVKAKVAKVTLTEEEKAKKLAEKLALKLAEKELAKQAKLAEKEQAKQAKLAEKKPTKPKKTKKVSESEAVAVDDGVSNISDDDSNTDSGSNNEEGNGSSSSEEELDVEDIEEEEVQEMKLKPFMFNGKKYGRAGDNTVYDLESQDEVGTWEEEKQVVVFN